MRTSRVMPPAVAVAHDTTKTPNRSSRCLTPAAAPLRANTNVPASSSTSSVPAAYALKPARVCRTCSALDVGIIAGYGTASSHPHANRAEEQSRTVTRSRTVASPARDRALPGDPGRRPGPSGPEYWCLMASQEPPKSSGSSAWRPSDSAVCHALMRVARGLGCATEHNDLRSLWENADGE